MKVKSRQIISNVGKLTNIWSLKSVFEVQIVISLIQVYVFRYRNIFTDNGEGSVMHAVQMSRIFPDSKTFVDMSLKKDPEMIREAFKGLLDGKEDGLQSMTGDDIRYENVNV